MEHCVKNLDFPNIFNIFGPLLNPMRPKRCVIGVYRRDLMLKVSEVLAVQKVNHALCNLMMAWMSLV